MYKKSDLFYTVLHVPSDAAAIILAFIVSYWVRGNGLEIYRLPFQEYLQLVYLSVPLWILIFALQGMYTKRYLFGTLQNLSYLAVSVLASWASFVVFLVFLKSEQTLVFPRLMLIYILLFGFVFVFVGRLLIRFIQSLARSFGLGRRRVLLLGEGKLVENMEVSLLDRTDPGINFIKRVDNLDPETLIKEAKKYRIDEVIIADQSLSDNKILEYIIALQNNGIVCHLVPNMFEVQASNVVLDTLAGLPLMTFRQTPLDGWGRIAKRIIDIVLSLIGLIVLSPIFLVIGLLIKATDTGPVFYPHARIGRNGKPFHVYKFRSMYTKYSTGQGFNPKSQVEIFREMGREDLIEEWKRDQKVKNDPRITPIGRLLRKSRLDELPQLVNVLRGEISLVGPRPITQEELSRYGRWGSYLLSIKPGLTGLWQVSGGNDTSYDERVKLDAHYVQNWSLWQDAVIIIKTFISLTKGRSGY